ncbi:MAG: hypothetical protein RI935_184 [Candidatus Parcubacteria bacterium]|jgi:hypothetical protein
MSNYVPLSDSNTLAELGIAVPNFSTQNPSVTDVTVFISVLFFTAIGFAVFFQGINIARLLFNPTQNNISLAKKYLQQVVFGIVGIFLMYVLFNSINTDILQANPILTTLKIPLNTAVNTLPGTPSNTNTTTGNRSSGNTSSGNTSSQTVQTGGCVRKTCSADPTGNLAKITGVNDQTVRQTLSQAGIDINRAACSSIAQRSCTNVGGMTKDVIQMLISLKAACDCAVTVSGGTEWWSHSTHGPGVSTVDLRIPTGVSGLPNLNDPLYKFISSQSYIGNSGSCHAVYKWGGWTFCDEKKGATSFSTGRHWHVYK